MKENLNVFRDALFYMKTRVTLKYFVNNVDTNDQLFVFNPTIMNIVINFIPNDIISCNSQDDDGLTTTCDVFIKKPHSC